ncbi:hypothetical protein EGT07_12410 [Herbaspirillum sp. HC18]|nr:hypothetical protein EGT07_12410 [Herbaspirillum sp. HC18]
MGGGVDEIPFVKVSVEEAKKSLQSDLAKKEVALPPPKDWHRARHPGTQKTEELAPASFKWLATLPRDVRPDNLANQYPRIANRIAEIWKKPLQCERYLDDLMMDMRGDRQGFPRAVAAEIAALKVYFFKTSNSVHFGVWGNRIGVD